jgi:Dolichyl-phosphate-mannose-protein mannosyltransferase
MSTAYDLELPPLDLSLEGPPPAESTPGPDRSLRQRLWRRLVDNKLDLAIVAVLMVIGGVVHYRGMYTSPARFDDEGTYTAYAWAVQNWHVLGHYTYWYAHPPLGWIQIALWTWTTHGFERAPYAVGAAREFMFVCKLASIALLYGLATRLGFGRVGRVLAVLIFALSPLAVYFTRAALLDNVVTPWLIASFFFAASPRRSVRGAAASAACLAAAVLSKETALLYLPAVVLLLVQHTDRRNRRFALTMFASWFFVICAAYPLYALIKNELLIGPGHVSLEWAVRWQLFGRTGSGSIFNPKSTAHAVIRSWLEQDKVLPRLSLVVAVPGLLIRRTRAAAAAFVIQVVQLLRGGYLPYPYVIAMIPFAALTVAGVIDRLWDLGRAPRLSRDTGPVRSGWYRRSLVFLGGRALWIPVLTVPLAERTRSRIRLAWRGLVTVAGAWLILLVVGAWTPPLHDLHTNNRDAGKAQALSWLESHVDHSDYLVVDDSFWVDLVEAGHPADHVVWFTKLDVDKDVRIPGDHQWAGISYVVLDHQDDLSVHVQGDGKPSKDTLTLFPTLGKALLYSRVVASFGTGLDAVTIRRVDPSLATTTKNGYGSPGAPAPDVSGVTAPGAYRRPARSATAAWSAA